MNSNPYIGFSILSEKVSLALIILVYFGAFESQIFFFNQQPALILFTFSFINLNQHAKSSVIRQNVTENMKVKQSASIKMNTKTIQGPQSCDFAKLCTDFIRIKLSLTRKYHHKI